MCGVYYSTSTKTMPAEGEETGKAKLSLNSTILGPFPVVLSLCFQARLSAKPLIWKWFLILTQIKLIFTRKVLYKGLGQTSNFSWQEPNLVRKFVKSELTSGSAIKSLSEWIIQHVLSVCFWGIERLKIVSEKNVDLHLRGTRLSQTNKLKKCIILYI